MIFICCFKWDSQVDIIIITSGGHYHRARPRKRANSTCCTGDYPLDISFVCWNLFDRKGWEEETEEAAHDRAATFRPHIRWWAPPYIVAHCISFLICINFFLMGCVLFSPCVYQNTWTPSHCRHCMCFDTEHQILNLHQTKLVSCVLSISVVFVLWFHHNHDQVKWTSASCRAVSPTSTTSATSPTRTAVWRPSSGGNNEDESGSNDENRDVKGDGNDNYLMIIDCYQWLWPGSH